MSEGPKAKEELVCDTCGRHGAVELGDRVLCPDCYSNSGAGCAGSDEDDFGC